MTRPLRIAILCIVALAFLMALMPIELALFVLLFCGEVFGFSLFLWRPRWRFVNFMGLALVSVCLAGTIAAYGGQ